MNLYGSLHFMYFDGNFAWSANIVDFLKGNIVLLSYLFPCEPTNWFSENYTKPIRSNDREC